MGKGELMTHRVQETQKIFKKSNFLTFLYTSPSSTHSYFVLCLVYIHAYHISESLSFVQVTFIF